MAIVEARNLRKIYRSLKRAPGLGGAVRALFSRDFEETVAVDDVSFALEPGEVVGYIGPNGAGKSTTIKMLTGILVPTSGSIRVAGIEPHQARARNAANIGVVFGQRSQLYWDLPLRESFALLRSIYDVPKQRFCENLAAFSAMLDLEEFMDTPVRQLSLGERMRGDFAAALLHEPAVVYLDEPTIGLDVVAKEAIREFVAAMARERGATVILTTHDLADVERLCKRIVLIDDGRVIYDGALQSLRDRFGTHRTLVIHFATPQDVREVAGAQIVEREPLTVHLRFDRRRTSARTLVREVMDRYAVADLAIVEPDIEAIVRSIYADKGSALRTSDA